MVKYQLNGDSDEARANLSFMAFDHVTWTPRYNILINPDVQTLKCEGKACIKCQDIFEEEITFPEFVLTGSITIEKNLDSFLKSNETKNEEEEAKDKRSLDSTQDDEEQQKKRKKKEDEYCDEELLVAVDVFEYCLKNLTLQKDFPVQVDMFDPIKADIYYNVYHIDIGKTSVKKALMFNNNTSHPLTSGPVTIVAKSNEQRKFLGNGNLPFTKPGETVVIETTPTMDILLKVKQEEKDLKYEKVWNRSLTRKEITITVEVENTLSTGTTCVIEYTAPGKRVLI